MSTSVLRWLRARRAPAGASIRTVAGGGLFFDLASHCFDLLDFILGPLRDVSGVAANTGHAYGAEDVVVASFATSGGVLGTGVWNFNASSAFDRVTFTGTSGEILMPVFSDTDVIVRGASGETVHIMRNPPHVHQPLIQAIVDEYPRRNALAVHRRERGPNVLGAGRVRGGVLQRAQGSRLMAKGLI